MKTTIITICKKYLLLIIAYFSPIHFLMGLIGLAIMLDTWMGRWAARHKAIKNGWVVREYVSSKKTRLGFSVKVLVYNLIILSVYGLDKFMMNDLFNYFVNDFPVQFVVSKSVGVVLFLMEVDSMDEKYYNVKGVSLKGKMIDKIKSLKDVAFKLVGFKKEIMK